MQKQVLSSLYPCAASVTMPQLGSDDAEISRHLGKRVSSLLSFKQGTLDNGPVDRRYLKKISTGLSFDESVVKERCFHMLPYDSRYLSEVLDVSDLIPSQTKAHHGYIPHGTSRRHMPCSTGITCISKPFLTPIKRKTTQQARKSYGKMNKEIEAVQHLQGVSSAQADVQADCKNADKSQVDKIRDGVFMTEVSESEPNPKQPETLEKLNQQLRQLQASQEQELEEDGGLQKSQRGDKRPKQEEKKRVDWDVYLLSQLSEVTATWMVHECTPGSKDQQKLAKTLEDWYGMPKTTDLVQEEMSDSEEDKKSVTKGKEKHSKKKWKKEEASLLEQVYQTPATSSSLDPYSDDNKAPFYRQPARIRRQRKQIEKEEEGTANSTAHRISVPERKLPAPPTMRDFFPHGVGDKLFDTDNQYERELLTGVKQVHQTGKDSSTILMASNNLYKKVLQKEYPENPSHWHPAVSDVRRKCRKDQQTKFEVGAQRWQGLPEPYDDAFEAQKILAPGVDADHPVSIDPASKRQVTQNHSLMQILNEWRTKWNLSGQYVDSTYEDIIQDMADIQPHVRLKAISMVGKAAELKAVHTSPLPTSRSVSLDQDVPDHVFVALDCLLSDANKEVKRAAAITLYALNHPTAKAEEILQKALQSDTSLERWTAAQCLAHYGICNSEVVHEIIKQILESEEPVKHEKGFALLARLSNSTTLVHSMVAEQLNSSSWRHRIIACKILPTLHGNINKDVTHKLSEMMWHDWHVDVRQAAAQCLGKTSHGQHVHDDILRCITYGSERIKQEAISRIGQLGIMTAKLLPAFLECFNDQYLSIRCECCITSGNLKIMDEQVIAKLVHLATFDPMWKVKALAIQALGKIGVSNNRVKECLQWAASYEEKDAVRAEACHSLGSLGLLDEDVVGLLQERLLVESSQIVQEEMVEALQKVGVAATEDMTMVAQIKKEVRKLCVPTAIASQIVQDEADEVRKNNLANMVFIPQAETQEKDIEHKASPVRRLQTMARASPTESRSRESKHGISSSLETVSREGTLYTPTADKEVEAILNREDISSSAPSTGTKSRPATGETTMTSRTYTSPDVLSREASAHTLFMDDVDEERATSAHKSAHESLNPSTISRLGLTPPALLLPGEQVSASNLIPTSSRHTILSRESLQEREKVNTQVRSTYDDLSARYADMEEEIIKIDKGLSAALTSTGQQFLKVPTDPIHDLSPSSSDLSFDSDNHYVLGDADYSEEAGTSGDEPDQVFDQVSENKKHLGTTNRISESRKEESTAEPITDEATAEPPPVVDRVLKEDEDNSVRLF